MSQEYLVRRANMDDVKNIHALLLQTAQKGLLLPRALIHLYSHIRNFQVIENAHNQLVACSALAPIWEDLGEICSLVVREDLRGQGLGRRIVHACLADSKILHIKSIFALTYQENFFTKLGFSIVDKAVLPQKIWADCVHCPKYPDCDETAVLLNLDENYTI